MSKNESVNYANDIDLVSNKIQEYKDYEILELKKHFENQSDDNKINDITPDS